jgi:N-acetylneuraminic acid mutarotase
MIPSRPRRPKESTNKNRIPLRMKKTVFMVLLQLLHMTSRAQVWQTMPDIPQDFVFPVVAALRGSIHIMGGGNNGLATDLHVRFSPATNTWDTLAPVPYRAQQPAGAVVDGKIHYCGGGFPTSGQPLNLHFYYDVDSDAWFAADTLPVAVAIHKCAELDGKLYVLSGQPDKTLCESYDPVTDSWTQLNPLPDMNFWYGVIVSANSTLYRFGGGGYAAPTAAAHVYDKVNDSWTPLPSLPVPLHGAAGTNDGDSVIWILGGYSSGNDRKEVWKYDINAQTYTLTDSLPVERSYLSSVTAGGCVYSVGGNNNGFPQVGVSMLQNCTPNFPASIDDREDQQKPYFFLSSNSFMKVQLNDASLKQAAVRLVDMQGKTVWEQVIQGQGGSVLLHNENFAPGMYLALIAIGNSSYVEQWMVTK